MNVTMNLSMKAPDAAAAIIRTNGQDNRQDFVKNRLDCLNGLKNIGESEKIERSNKPREACLENIVAPVLLVELVGMVISTFVSLMAS